MSVAGARIAVARVGTHPGKSDRRMVAVSSRLPRSIQVMRHRDSALVQVGNGVSQLGTWGQYVALGWGIRQLTAWPFAVTLSLVARCRRSCCWRRSAARSPTAAAGGRWW